MKKTYLKVAAIAICGVFAVTACKKKDESKSKTTYLTQGAWKMTDIELGAGGTFGSVFSQQPACLKDDIYTFNTNGQVTKDEGAVKCDTAQTETGTWAFTNDEGKLSVIVGGEDIGGDVSTLNDNTLQVVTNDSIAGNPVSYRYTFGH